MKLPRFKKRLNTQVVVTHPKAPGTRLIGWDCGGDILSLPGGTFIDVELKRSQGWVWKSRRGWWQYVIRL